MIDRARETEGITNGIQRHDLCDEATCLVMTRAIRPLGEIQGIGDCPRPNRYFPGARIIFTLTEKPKDFANLTVLLYSHDQRHLDWAEVSLEIVTQEIAKKKKNHRFE